MIKELQKKMLLCTWTKLHQCPVSHSSLSYKLSDLPYPSFTFAAQTDLFTQAGFQQKLAKKKQEEKWQSLSDKCAFGKGHTACFFLKCQPPLQVFDSSCFFQRLLINSVRRSTNKSKAGRLRRVTASQRV